jgi:branched-chain amino acid transport system permease protein
MMKNFKLRDTINQGLIAGVISLSVAMIGMVELFGERYLINNVLTMGQVLVFLAPTVLVYLAATKLEHKDIGRAIVQALVISIVTSLMMGALILLESRVDMRSIFLNVSPRLIELLTFERGISAGSLILFAGYVATSLAAVGLRFIPDIISVPIIYGLLTTLGVGLLSEILVERVRTFFGSEATNLIFASRALEIIPAIVLFVGSTVVYYLLQLRSQRKAEKKAAAGGRSLISSGITGLVLISLPFILGTYLTEVANNVGLYLLMGLGLNIVVGLAGLLDLGYVAFFAIGAYTMAVLTSLGDLGVAQMSFWLALPIAVAVSALAGLILGMPVLRMRGDYLAIVTMGFGEIIRILALSDMLKPFIGGAQGVLQIPKPEFAGMSLIQPQQLYYVVLGGVLATAFISVRLRESRLGRRWMAIREDEDVAEAMGINLVATKLLAFGIGAAFSGLAGAINAAKLTSIFPHSFSLLVSINVLCLIIVGGLGSIPGTVAGAIALVGLPEILRGFQEFRWLMYGVLLIAMMLTRPEGFIPSDVIKREMHADNESGQETPPDPSAAEA